MIDHMLTMSYLHALAAQKADVTLECISKSCLEGAL